MSGYISVIAPCFSCRRLFSFHPHLVPSVLVNGTREAVCANCVAVANPRRVANGLPPIEVLPGAYEAAEESEIDWSDE